MSSPVPQFRSRIPRLAEVAAERARLTVVPRRRTRAARVPFVALVTIVLLGGVVGLLLFNTSMQQASFAATALEGQADTLAARQQALQMDLDRLRNPQRIADKAQRLGMIQAGNPAFVQLGTGEVSGQPSAGDPAVPFRIWPTITKPAVLNPRPHVVTVPPEGTLPDARNGNRNGNPSGNSGDTGHQVTSNGTASGKNHQNQQSHQPQNQNQR
jgi:cell division protein FtsB